MSTAAWNAAPDSGEGLPQAPRCPTPAHRAAQYQRRKEKSIRIPRAMWERDKEGLGRTPAALAARQAVYPIGSWKRAGARAGEQNHLECGSGQRRGASSRAAVPKCCSRRGRVPTGGRRSQAELPSRRDLAAWPGGPGADVPFPGPSASGGRGVTRGPATGDRHSKVRRSAPWDRHGLGRRTGRWEGGPVGRPREPAGSGAPGSDR